ncbi:MAG TPA: glycosyltransferase [Oligoflexus sp.]|uniref:glycosyltransferase n=1 Tax=Oligoflexus sp. TaxID=1971216 RepID=UPI002D2D71FE|nr:glycosyltransferase [Oligoflexus sp.]HYX39726.1 glycosyltransferase [Oligoflexus sp.]
MVGEWLASIGLMLLIYRIWPRHFRPCMYEPAGWPLVSIIVPARNEENVLGQLLASLDHLDYPHYEVIVVDDCSDDDTAAIALSHKLRLVRGKERPAGWNGKQWACHQGAMAAKGSYLLFTDADTIHHTTGLRRAMCEVLDCEAQGFTTLPAHQSPTLWERLCGPFHVLLMAVTNPYGKARPGQVFAIGQYLLFERKFYDRFGGHTRVRADWVEDIPLAEALLAEGGRWVVYTGPAIFSVRMYETMGDFVRGWRRNFRAGMGYSYWGASLEITLFMAAAIGGGRLNALYPWLIILLTALVFLRAQEKLGRFSAWGVLLFPFSLVLFCWVSILAVYDRLFNRPMNWKNRAYPASATPAVGQLRAPGSP